MAKKKSKKKVEIDKNTEPVENQAEEVNLEDQVQEERDKFLRLFAEFENYKRRTAKERIELFSTASEEVMISLLPILDDFDRASAEIEKDKEKELLLKDISKHKNFNKIFNELFEKNYIAEEELSKGYGEWLKNSEDDNINIIILTVF